jgi:hypothetical protein
MCVPTLNYSWNSDIVENSCHTFLASQADNSVTGVKSSAFFFLRAFGQKIKQLFVRLCVRKDN